jgi:hypothetical protein
VINFISLIYIVLCGKFMCAGVDGCFVKLTDGAQVLAATARDDNNNLFPLAFGVVGKEDYKNRKWFLQLFQIAIGDGMEHGG